MPTLDFVLSVIRAFIPLILVTAVVFVTLKIVQWLWLGKRIHRFSDQKIIPQVIMLILGNVGVICIVLALPISENLRGNILSLLGLVLTGVMALSSTTFVANAFAGSMLRLTRSFRIGDYIKVGEQGGRVSERGIFHTEIQTEDRDLTTFPNLYLVNNPVTVVRSSGTIISATVSLGYDLEHGKVESLLIAAAEQVGLLDPFVHVTELGDFSVGYRVSGFLEESKIMLTKRSELRKSMLDALHGAQVEIVSPNFMVQRPQQPGVRCIPKASAERPPAAAHAAGTDTEKTAEEMAFDKADDAEVAEEMAAQDVESTESA
jgi:small-conductance mechanosensitive channel